jgi:hypothetical protein
MHLLRIGLFAGVLTVGGCGDDVSTGGSGGGSIGGEAGAGGASPTTTSSSSAGGGAPEGCDGNPATSCNGSTYCDAEGACPSADALGQCLPRPAECLDDGPPACACDGEVYVNECEAHQAGYAVESQAGCVVPTDPFSCGAVLCENGVDYCESTNGHENCQPLPAACLDADAECSCLEAVQCVSAPGETRCEKDAEGHFVVTCVVTE